MIFEVCGVFVGLERGKLVYVEVVKLGFEFDIVVVIFFIGMYFKCG